MSVCCQQNLKVEELLVMYSYCAWCLLTLKEALKQFVCKFTASHLGRQSGEFH